METIFLPETLSIWLMQYGSIALFVLLALGIFALPIPDETLMVFAGMLIAKNQLSMFPTILAAFSGTLMGISISYAIGCTAGAFLIKKYGYLVRLTDEKMARVHAWFERIGRWALLIGYFIPGIRHLTGYAAGTTKMAYRHFITFAAFGAAIWVSLFLSLGYFLGERWENIIALIEEHWEYLALGVFVLASVLAISYLWMRQAKKVKA